MVSCQVEGRRMQYFVAATYGETSGKTERAAYGVYRPRKGIG